MATLIKNIPKPSFAIEGNKGISFPLKGRCLPLNVLSVKDCPIFVESGTAEISLEQDTLISIVAPCDLEFEEIIYTAQGIIEFDNQNNSIQLTFWGSTIFYSCIYEDENFVMSSGLIIKKPITKNKTTNLTVIDEAGSREFKIKMAEDPKNNQVFLVNTLSNIAMKTVLDSKIAGQYNLVSSFDGGSSTVTFSF